MNKVPVTQPSLPNPLSSLCLVILQRAPESGFHSCSFLVNRFFSSRCFRLKVKEGHLLVFSYHGPSHTGSSDSHGQAFVFIRSHFLNVLIFLSYFASEKLS